LNEKNITVFYYSTNKESFLDYSILKTLETKATKILGDFYILKVGFKFFACQNLDRYYTERIFNIKREINKAEVIVKATKAAELQEM
jgi:hypothetical protein